MHTRVYQPSKVKKGAVWDGQVGEPVVRVGSKEDRRRNAKNVCKEKVKEVEGNVLSPLNTQKIDDKEHRIHHPFVGERRQNCNTSHDRDRKDAQPLSRKTARQEILIQGDGR